MRRLLQAFPKALGLRAKIGLAVSGLLLAFLAAILWFTLSYSEAEYRRQIFKQQSGLAAALRTSIEDKLRLAQSALIAVAKRVPSEALRDAEQAQAFLDDKQALLSIFDNVVFLTSKNGKLIAESPFVPRPDRRGLDLSYREYFQQTVATKRPYISKPFRSTHNPGQPALVMTAPLFDQRGDLVGMLAGSFDLLGDNVLGSLSNIAIGDTGYVAVVDPDGVIISHPDKKRVMQSVAPGANALFDRAMRGIEGSGETVTSSGLRVLSTFVFVGPTKWVLGVSYPIAEAYAPLRKAQRYFAAAAVLGTGLILLFVWLFAKRLTASLSLLTEHVETLWQKPGEQRRVQVKAGDEVEKLAQAFNLMIAELEKERDALQASEGKYRTLVENTPDIIARFDPDYRFAFVSSSCSHYLPFRPKDVVGKTHRELGFPDEIANVWDARIREVFGTGAPMDLDVEIQTLKGMRVFNWRAFPEIDRSGRVISVVTTSRDITERQRAAEALREAEERYRSLLRASSDGIWIHHDGRIDYVNDALIRMLGYSGPEELVGREIYEFFAPEALEALRRRVAWIIKEGLPTSLTEAVMLRRGGTRIEVETTGASFRQKDTVWIIAIIRDITGRKRASEQLRLAASVFDNAAEGIMVTDKDNNVISVNKAFTEITGYSSQEASGKNPRMLQSGEQTQAFYGRMWGSITKAGRWTGEIRDRRKNGELCWLLLSINTIRNEQGEVIQHCAIFADITERKTAEEALIGLNAELEGRIARRTAELESFSYSVSHDLRAPLRTITGFSAIVIEKNQTKLDPQSVDYLKRIGAGADRMALLIDDLLKLSRVSRLEMKRQDIDLSDLAGKVIDALIKTHPGRKLEVTVAPDMSVNGDPGLVRILLENLLENAWKFTSRISEASIEVGYEERDGETAYFVRDNGAGFDMQYADKLFGAFQRLHADRDFEGPGIGLSTVQRIAARHGGRVWAEGKTGQGATFYFTLG